jgi:hypothetical protein
MMRSHFSNSIARFSLRCLKIGKLYSLRINDIVPQEVEVKKIPLHGLLPEIAEVGPTQCGRAGSGTKAHDEQSGVISAPVYLRA